MLGRLLAVAGHARRRILGLLTLLALAGLIAGVLAPVDGRLDRLAPSGSSVAQATETERASFGGDTALVVVRGKMLDTVRGTDLAVLAALQGCLAGVPNPEAKGPCARIRDLKGVKYAEGPGGFANSSLAQIQGSAQTRLQQSALAAQQAREEAEAAAKKAGASKAEITAAGEAAQQQAVIGGYIEALRFAQELGLTQDTSLIDPEFAKDLFFARGSDGKLGPKRRLAWLIPNNNAALIQVQLRSDLSAGERNELISALRAAVAHPAFKLGSGATYEFTGIAPVTQDLADAIRRSALALTAAALLVMAAVLLFARRLRRRLLPVLVAAAVAGGALIALTLPGGALSLAAVVALPVLVGIAVDQAVQAQLRLQRRLAAGALRTLIIAGAAAAASSLALLASPFGLVRLVGIAVAGAILLAILFAALAAAAVARTGGGAPAPAEAAPATTRRARKKPAALRRPAWLRRPDWLRRPSWLRGRRHGGSGRAPGRLTAWRTQTAASVAGAAADADALVGASPPVRGVLAAARRLAIIAARITPRAGSAILVAGALLAVAGLGLGSGTRVETGLPSLVSPESDGSRQLEALRQDVGLSSTLTLVLESKELGDPAIWRYLVQAQRTVMGETNGRCDGERLCVPLPLDELFGTSADGKLPTDAEIESGLQALPQSFTRGFVDPDRGVLALPFGVGTLDGDRQREYVGQLQAIADRAPGNVTAGVAGLPAVADAGADALESSGNRALLMGLALLLPAALLLVITRAPRRTIVALVPPAFALGWSELVLWLLGLPRTPLTAALGVLVAAVAIEFSVLLGERFAALRRVGVPRGRAIEATLRETGGAVAISAGATIAGFAVLSLASIPLIADFGLVTALDLALVLLALVVVAPATWVLADRPDAGEASGAVAARRAPSTPAARSSNPAR